MSHLPLFQVDAFTSQPFSGNPAAVCLLEQEADSHWMQRVGAEMNLSETAFVWRMAEGFGLRWFTPATEVDLCGHAPGGFAGSTGHPQRCRVFQPDGLSGAAG